ncbi:MAG: adenosine-specific kinase [Candidatus Bathyarchaeia archaeon]
MEFEAVAVTPPREGNLIIGMAHFIKTVEDLYEVLVGSVPGIRFGLAFCEASGPCLVRHAGNDAELEGFAVDAALRIGAGHSFIIALRGAYPINVLNALKMVQEVCTVYCATANPVEVLVAETGQGRAVIGVVDGYKPKGVEGPTEAEERKKFLRGIGYKL